MGTTDDTTTRAPTNRRARASELVAFPWGDVELTTAGSGPAVVVLHRDLGPIGCAELVDVLATDHRVIQVSLPGFGRSSMPSWARSVAHLAALIGRVLDGCAPAATVVGLGFGGWVAAELVATSPARVGALALVSPMGVRPRAGEVLDQFLFSPSRYAALAAGGDDQRDRLLAELPADQVDEFLDRSREAVTRVAWKPIGHDPALIGLLPCVRVRAAVVWGSEDRIVPPSTAAQWAALLATERVEFVDGAPHIVEFTHASVVANTVAALERVPATPTYRMPGVA
jgi:pimeloyl-ACP methyl ester carboxylesterase